jgi:hypothetical protein
MVPRPARRQGRHDAKESSAAALFGKIFAMSRWRQVRDDALARCAGAELRNPSDR